MATLQSQTFNGLEGGLNLAKPAIELDDNEARLLQDVLLDYPGLIRSRGPVELEAGFPTFAEKASGIAGTISPSGSYRLAVLTGTNSTGYLKLLSNDFASFVSYNWPYALPTSPPGNPYHFVDAKPTLGGGVAIGTSSAYNSAQPGQALALWRGGNNVDYTTGQVSLTRGSATVTGTGTSFNANVSPGMFLFASASDSGAAGIFSNTYIGVVKSVDSNTQLTLNAVSPYSTGAVSYKLTSVRGLQYRIVKGRLTTNTSSTTVTGANTKFLSQFMEDVMFSGSGTLTNTSAVVTGLSSTASIKVGMRVTGTNVPVSTFVSSVDSGSQITMSQAATGTGASTLTFRNNWNLYRASDFAWIGRVTTVNNEVSLTLAANAALALNNERFIALNGTGDWGLNNTSSIYKVGFLTATYAGRQWYANNGRALDTTSQVWFSDPSDLEGLDLASFDGDFIPIASSTGADTPIKAIVPAHNALVVIKENEAYAITGSSPATFSVKKIQDDGCLSGMSVQPYQGGVIWAGVDGIHFYDGIQVRNISEDKLGNYYKNAVRDVDPVDYHMWSMIVRDHYFLFIENYAPSVPVVKGTTSTTPNSVCIVLNMVTGAYSFHTNLNIRGYVETPADTGKQVLYVVNDSTKANICSGFSLFDVENKDSILCDLGLSAGQYVYGVQSIGSSTSFHGAANTKYFSKITTVARSAVKSIRVYSTGQGGGSGSCNVRAGLYSDVAGVPTSLLGSSGVVTLSQADGPAFREYTFAAPIEIAAGDYWIGVQVETSSRVDFYQGATTNAMASNSDTYSDGLTNPFGAVTNNNGPLVANAVVLTVGPDVFIESKKYAEGDAMRKKLFKQLSATYLAQGDVMKLDTVPSLNNIGKTSATTFPTTVYTWDQLALLVGTWDALAQLYPTWDSLTQANFKPKRIKFLKRSQELSFRIYQNSPANTRFQLGPFALYFKWQRVGRI